MNCPKCHSDMEKVTFASIEVDRCVKCGGIWFDMREQVHLKAAKDSEQVDTGDPQQAEGLNEMGAVVCPVCETQMVRMVDADQPHIWYESCPVCHGVFFDAGEFTDYKQETLGDFFKDLFSKERQ